MTLDPRLAQLVSRGRHHLADTLANWAHRLDPTRPLVRRDGEGRLTISAHGIDLARIDPGMVQTTRGPAYYR